MAVSIADIAQAYLDGRGDATRRPPRKPLLPRLARAAGLGAAQLRRARGGLLQLAGLASIDLAVWQGQGAVWGLAAVGVSLFVLEWLSSEERRR